MDFWQPNPNAEPFIPKRELNKNIKSQFRAKLFKNRFINRIFQAVLVIILMITITLNMVFIFDTSQRLHGELSNRVGSSYVNQGDSDHPENLLDEITPSSLSIEVLSSQSRVTVTIDGATVCILL
ncbi:protein O-linked-mannose beta-1,2-N-acetylglucosaminyltransferase 1-like [Halyomorpha halys]|uniref:protein O-linked-mannose beta-1,2-N-acetylglucosaminyltransferase 1-like n=1 Tax=Halyomorpha halys TaxID=286706 RepID=UPI0034D35905